MAMMIRHDYSDIHEALNKMIIAEVKAWLKEMPEERMESDENRVPLCRIVVSDADDYLPVDVDVRRVWLDDENVLKFSQYEARYDKDNEYVWSENDDMLDITDFGYLIDQMLEKLEMPEGAWYIMEGYMASCGYTAEERMKQAMKKEVTV